MQIAFISSLAIITDDPAQSRSLFVESLGLPLSGAVGDDYVFSETIEGSKHFGVWPLTQAAQMCFGTPTWPADRKVPQVSIEFDVESEQAVAEAANELEGRGYTLLHGSRMEPWGQTVARLQTHEGAVIGISYIPVMH
jgi:catechol 2,3-dioxygenase-like lactoylglutathione lyase family enzyme